MRAKIKLIREKVRPGRGFAHIFHLSLVAVVPALVFIFVRLEFYGVALAVILLSKWRMLAVRPRHWLAHVRTNAVDIIVSLSILAFMIRANQVEQMSQMLLWVLLYEVWVLYIKPSSRTLLVSLQALLAQLGGLVALFLFFEELPLGVYIVAVGAIAYFSARHFFASFEEDMTIAYSWLWTFFAASLTWVLGHWVLFYGPIAQIALLISVIGYGLATLYYLNETDRLSKPLQKQVLFVVFAIVFVMLAFSNWGDTTV